MAFQDQIRPRTDFPIDAFRACCVWEESGDWETMAGQDESSIRPRSGLAEINSGINDPATLTLNCRTADGEPLFGVASFTFLDYLNYQRQSLLKAIDFSFYYQDRWIYYNSIWPRLAEVSAAFGKPVEAIFPIQFQTVASLNGIPIAGSLGAGEHQGVTHSSHV